LGLTPDHSGRGVPAAPVTLPPPPPPPLPPPASMDLRFAHQHRRAQPDRSALRLFGSMSEKATRHRHAVFREDFLGLVLVNFHDGPDREKRKLSPTLTDLRWTGGGFGLLVRGEDILEQLLGDTTVHRRNGGGERYLL